MLIKAKALQDATWKDVVAKNKTIKDNGLLKSLAELKRVDENRHDEADKLLDEVIKLLTQLKKDKAVAALPAVQKQITEMLAAAEAQQRDVAKAKAEHDKAQKAKAEAEKKAAAKKDEDEADEDDEEVSSELLTTKLKPLLKLVTKGETMHALVGKAGKQVSVLLSRKPISPVRRKLLTESLGGGSTKFYPGHCLLDAGAVTFVLKAEVAGMAKLIKLALLSQTGLRMNKVKCRGEDGDDDDEDSPDAPGAELPAGDDDEPAPPRGGEATGEDAELARAPQVWDGTRELLQRNVDALRRAVREQAAGEAADVIAQLDGQLAQLDRVFRRLDRRLSESLAKAAQAKGDERRAELAIARALLADYAAYVRSEPLIRHLDENPFGVSPDLESTLSSSLGQLAQAIG